VGLAPAGWPPSADRGVCRQDFKDALRLGGDGTTIDGSDADGATLAAVRGLDALRRTLAGRADALRARIADMEARMRDQAARAAALAARAAALSGLAAAALA
jgi:hypothetical protein